MMGSGELSDAQVILIRQAFYEGLARCCLASAWSNINDYRQTHTQFLGRELAKPGISQLKIATALGRNTGTICRWLNGESPNWAYLMMLMVAVDADWQHVGELPSKKERRLGGKSQAIAQVRKLLTSATDFAAPSLKILRHLELLFGVNRWVTARRQPTVRLDLIEQLASQSGSSPQELDQVDAEWGDSYVLYLTAFASTLDEALWH